MMTRDDIYEKICNEARSQMYSAVAKLDIAEQVMASAAVNQIRKDMSSEGYDEKGLTDSVNVAVAETIDSTCINYFQANCDGSIPFGMDGLNILIMAVMELGKASGELNNRLHAICFEGDDFGIHEDPIKRALNNAMVAIAHAASALSVDMSTIIREGRLET